MTATHAGHAATLQNSTDDPYAALNALRLCSPVRRTARQLEVLGAAAVVRGPADGLLASLISELDGTKSFDDLCIATGVERARVAQVCSALVRTGSVTQLGHEHLLSRLSVRQRERRASQTSLPNRALRLLSTLGIDLSGAPGARLVRGTGLVLLELGTSGALAASMVCGPHQRLNAPRERWIHTLNCPSERGHAKFLIFVHGGRLNNSGADEALRAFGAVGGAVISANGGWAWYEDFAATELSELLTGAPSALISVLRLGAPLPSVVTASRSKLILRCAQTPSGPLGLCIAQMHLKRDGGLDSVATGVGVASFDAIEACLGERTERLTAARPRVDRRAKPQYATTPEMLTAVLRWQERHAKAFQVGNDRYALLDPRRDYEWVAGKWRNSKVYLPIDFAYYPLSPRHLSRPLLWRGNSSGVAYHPNRTIAETSALLELIERGAFLKSWEGGSPPKRIRKSHWPTWIRNSEAELWRPLGVRVLLLQLSAATPTVAVALLQDDWPSVTLGMSSRYTFAAAARKAYMEAAASFVSAGPKPSRRIPEDSVDSPLDHANRFRWPGSNEELGWFFRGNYNPPTDSPNQQELTGVVNSAIFLNLSRSPRFVIRALSTQIEPMWFGHQWAPEGVPLHFFG